MANLKLSHIYKVYDNGHKAVNDFSIDIADKEFIVFVGPSGCGKSTTLRMIAGLEKITAGDLFIGDTLVNDMEPKDRDIAMVFQSYALYPHMTVFENMAFGLRNRHLPQAEIKKKVLEAAKMLDIEEYLDRKPKAMSGGQRQRVALGRALVRDPKVFLLDEPLSNLDAKLRAQMRTEITKLHKKLATTFIYVTHDQIEAMTMGTRIVVMKLGYVQQIDTPMNLYNEPYNKFVAGFIGTPQMNFFDVTLNRVGDEVEIKFVNDSIIKIPYEKVCRIHEDYLHGDRSVIFGIRPEHLEVSKKDGLACVINAVEHLGNECILYGQLGSSEEEFTMKDEGKSIILKSSEDNTIAVGDVIHIAPNEDKVHFFDAKSEITIMPRIPAFSIFDASVTGAKLNFLGSSLPLCPAFKGAIGESQKISIEVPPTAIIPGHDYALKVARIERDGDKNLAFLAQDNRYLFALVDDSVKVGDLYKFDILNEKVRLLIDGEIVLEPISQDESLIGQFSKEEIREKVPPLSEEEVAAIDQRIEKIQVSIDEKVSLLLDAQDKASQLKDVKKSLNESTKELKKWQKALAAKDISEAEKATLNESISASEKKSDELQNLLSSLQEDKDNIPGLKQDINNLKSEVKDLQFRKKPVNGMRRNYHFYATLEGKVIDEIPVDNGYKMNSVDGNNCYKKSYRYVLNRDLIQRVEEGGLLGQVEGVYDYGDAVYALVDIGKQKLLINVEKDFALPEVHLAFPGKDLSIYSLDIEMKIC